VLAGAEVSREGSEGIELSPADGKQWVSMLEVGALRGKAPWVLRNQFWTAGVSLSEKSSQMWQLLGPLCLAVTIQPIFR
jgi:hypothetical protein